MGRISIAMPPSIASEFSTHDGAGPWFTFGDLQGKADGGVDVLIYKRNKVLVAASLDIDWVAGTGTLAPLWVWKPTVLDGQSHIPTGSGGGEGNCLIFDIDGDGENEVVFNWEQKQGADYLTCLKADPSPAPGPYANGAPPPLEIAKKNHVWGPSRRLTRVRLSDTDGPMDIAFTGHQMRPAGGGSGSGVQVWSMQAAAPGGPRPYEFVKRFEVDVTKTLNLTPEETHEFNAADIDNDGYDEFFINGVLDFVDDVGGVATPTNSQYPENGVQVWATDVTGSAHIDQMICADWDPSNPGLEIKGTPQAQFVDSFGIQHPGFDLIYDATGAVISEGVNTPAVHGQSILGGNFTNTRDGFESIQLPKGRGVVINPNSNAVPGKCTVSFLTGCYVSDSQCVALATDGANWLDGNCPNPWANTSDYAATGPSDFMMQVDWDGDYSQDEILDYGWSSLFVWRMGEKGDWLPGPLPTGMPTQLELANPVVYPTGSGHVFFYQGENGTDPSRNWNNGGVGLFTHYFQKVGESGMGSRYWHPKGFDLGLDYREEAVAIIKDDMHIFYNLNDNPNLNSRISPRFVESYVQYRGEPLHVSGVFDYQKLPVLDVAQLFASTGLNPAVLDANGPNGILDYEEIGLLFEVLQDPSAWQRAQVEAAWNANLDQVFAEMGTHVSDLDPLIMAAAYATLGDLGSLSAAGTLLGVSLQAGDFDLSQASTLSASGDLDGDGLSNLIERGIATSAEDYSRHVLSPSFGVIMPLAGLPTATTDINGVDRTTATPVYYQSNGMSDVAELSLLSYLLYDRDSWLHGKAWEEWNSNMTQLLEDAGGASHPVYALNLIAGYMTIGDLDSQDTSEQIAASLGTTISASNYSAQLADLLSKAADPDLDSLDNQAEYTAVGGDLFNYFFEATTPDFDAAITSTGLAPLAIDYNGSPLFFPNGIPDGPELFLLRTVLRNSTAPGHETMKSAFNQTLGQLVSEAILAAQGSAAGGYPAMSAQDILYFAGILTLGDADSRSFAKQRLEAFYRLTLDLSTYPQAGSELVAATADLDQDGLSNLTEYAASSNQIDYASRAMDSGY